jgi:putative ABC transport system ATP-binding protein
MVFQKPYFVRNISVLENLLLSLYLSKNKQDEKKALHLLEQIGLADKKNHQPNQLSQGEQQRMSIALAVLKNPDLILADEPTSSLDDTNCYKIAQLLEEQAQSTNAQLIIITHDSRLKTHFNNSITL